MTLLQSTKLYIGLLNTWLIRNLPQSEYDDIFHVPDRRQAGENRAGSERTIAPLCLNTTPLPSPHGQPQYLKEKVQNVIIIIIQI